MAEDIPGVQIQGGPGPRRLVNLPHNNAVAQFQKKNARLGGYAYVQRGTNIPAFSEHPKYCRLYVNDAAAVRAALELAASKFGIPLIVNGDPQLCKTILAAAAEMGISISSNTVPAPPSSNRQPEEPKTSPIKNGSLVRFVPNDTRMATHEGIVKDSSTADGFSYRYRLELPDKRVVSVYSDEGEITPVIREQVKPMDKQPRSAPPAQTLSTPAWKLLKAEYLANLPRVRADVGMNSPGYKVDYEYTTPDIAGPFSGVFALPIKPNVNDTVNAPFGEAKVTKTSSSVINVDDAGVLRAGKLHHRRLVVDALKSGKPVPTAVIAEYIEVQPIVDKWIQEQIAKGQSLPAIHYNGSPSKRGGTIYVTYDEPTDSYSVSHTINGNSYAHVTGVDAEGAREAAHNLFGHAPARTPPPLSAQPAQLEREQPKPFVVIEPIPSLDLSKIIEEADAAGETDFLAVLQTTFNQLTKQANDRISAAANQQVDNVHAPGMAAQMALNEWTQSLEFLGSDPVTIANKWRGVITERDGLQDQVAELKTRINTFVDKSHITEEETENE